MLALSNRKLSYALPRFTNSSLGYWADIFMRKIVSKCFFFKPPFGINSLNTRPMHSCCCRDFRTYEVFKFSDEGGSFIKIPSQRYTKHFADRIDRNHYQFENSSLQLTFYYVSAVDVSAVDVKQCVTSINYCSCW